MLSFVTIPIQFRTGIMTYAFPPTNGLFMTVEGVFKCHGPGFFKNSLELNTLLDINALMSLLAGYDLR